jgi:hypothetical protein
MQPKPLTLEAIEALPPDRRLRAIDEYLTAIRTREANTILVRARTIRELRAEGWTYRRLAEEARLAEGYVREVAKVQP